MIILRNVSAKLSFHNIFTMFVELMLLWFDAHSII